MKKLSLLLLLALLVSASTALAAEMFRVTASRANVRSGAGTQYDIVTSVSRGEKYEVLAQKGKWVKIMLPSGADGWVYGDLGESVFTEEKRPVREVKKRPAPFRIRRRRRRVSTGMFEFGGTASFGFGNGTRIGITPVVGYFVTPAIEAEGTLILTRSESGGFSTTTFGLTADGLYHYRLPIDVLPYGFFGLGFQNVSTGGSGTAGLLLEFGGGARYFLTDTWNVRGELKFGKWFVSGSDFTVDIGAYITGLKMF
ncbi:MAG: SH3 domain-containing protein [bacterium]